MTTDVCAERWHGGNAAVTCQKPIHPEDEWHESVITKTEQINYPTAKVTSTTTDAVTWEGLGASLHRLLDRKKDT